MADRVGKVRRDLARERLVLSAEIEREGHELDMPCERCWNAKPRRRCVMKEGLNKCSHCVRMGKRYSGPNVADVRKCDDPVVLCVVLTA